MKRTYMNDLGFKEKNIAGYLQNGELVPVLIASITQNQATVVGVNRKTEKIYLRLTDLQPLPLTPARLLKLQFKPQASDKYIYNNCNLTVIDDTYRVNIDYFYETIKYVHELQNFYRLRSGFMLPLPFIK